MKLKFDDAHGKARDIVLDNAKPSKTHPLEEEPNIFLGFEDASIHQKFHDMNFTLARFKSPPFPFFRYKNAKRRNT